MGKNKLNFGGRETLNLSNPPFWCAVKMPQRPSFLTFIFELDVLSNPKNQTLIAAFTKVRRWQRKRAKLMVSWRYLVAPSSQKSSRESRNEWRLWSTVGSRHTWAKTHPPNLARQLSRVWWLNRKWVETKLSLKVVLRQAGWSEMIA